MSEGPMRLRARHWAVWETTMRTGITRYGSGQLLAVPALRQDGRQISCVPSDEMSVTPDGYPT